MDNSQQPRETGRINVGGERDSFGSRPPAHGSNTSGVDSNRPVIVGALYIASFFTAFTGLIGVVLAHIWAGDARGTWAESHYTYLIRTFWFGLLGTVVGALLTIILVGFLVLMFVAVWFGVRSVLSIVKASKGEPMPNPETLWV